MTDKFTHFRDHHVLEQRSVKFNYELHELADAGLFDMHGSRNLIKLPTSSEFASVLGISPHGGRHIAEYQDGISANLHRFWQSPDYFAFIQQGDIEAGKRIAGQIELFQDGLRIGFSNGELFTNAPHGLKPNDIRADVRSFFDNQSQFAVRNADAIRAISTMQNEELAGEPSSTRRREWLPHSTKCRSQPPT